MVFVAIILAVLGFVLGFFVFGRRRVVVRQSGEDLLELARALAHEVRNPLNTIKMNLQLMSEEIGDDEKFAARLARVEEELSRLDRILKSFLDYSRLPSPDFRRTDINDVVRRAVDVMRARCDNVEIQLRVADNLPAIKVDAALVAQVLHNLLQNAIEASQEGGAIVVETMKTATGVAISVADKGKGIPPELLDKVFKPYFSTKRGGVGIGMAVVKKIVELHGGRIQIQSRVGSGTRVVVEFPQR